MGYNEDKIIEIITFSYNIKLFRFNCALKYARKNNSYLNLNDNNASIVNAEANISLLKKDANKNNIEIISYSAEELKEQVNKIFSNDPFGTMRQSFIFDLIIDRSYNYDQKFEKEIFEELSFVFGENKNYILSFKKKIYSDFVSMFKNPNKGVKSALIVGGVSAVLLLAMVPPLIGGLKSGASVFTSTLKSLFGGIGMQESVFALSCLAVGVPISAGILTYGAIQIKDRIDIRKYYKKLSSDDLAINLLKMVYSLKKIDLYREVNENAENTFKIMLEQFNDLRSDFLFEFIDRKCSPIKQKLELFNKAEFILAELIGA